jgi:hypothetical protein
MGGACRLCAYFLIGMCEGCSGQRQLHPRGWRGEWTTCAKLLFWHDQNATEFIDLCGETYRLRLQHVHRVTLMSLLRKLRDTLIERSEFAKQPSKLFLDWRSPGQPFWV